MASSCRQPQAPVILNRANSFAGCAPYAGMFYPRYSKIEFDKNKIRQGARIGRALQRMRMREIENVNRSVEPLSRSSPIPRRWLIQRNLPTFVRGLNSV
ncbi:hypothetical protein ALC62_09646 [Cyphomyrmex costatus]|uniref:Uncharacterized protein n=1 Tax=Cyphomyrmex costatus TaxID=456900 RepID=A0A151IFQ9_9HYME|nr:hypothetical protein ALC62_09646 [Cyphomyrmex costatus]